MSYSLIYSTSKCLWDRTNLLLQPRYFYFLAYHHEKETGKRTPSPFFAEGRKETTHHSHTHGSHINTGSKSENWNRRGYNFRRALGYNFLLCKHVWNLAVRLLFMANIWSIHPLWTQLLSSCVAFTDLPFSSMNTVGFLFCGGKEY